MPSQRNIIGVQVKSLRQAKELSQAMLAARCSVLGWDISENGITKIETGLRCVNDREVVLLAEALRVKVREFYPDKKHLF